MPSATAEPGNPNPPCSSLPARALRRGGPGPLLAALLSRREGLDGGMSVGCEDAYPPCCAESSPRRLYRAEQNAGFAVEDAVDGADFAQHAIEIAEAGGADLCDQVP